jgi:hypothetical protein
MVDAAAQADTPQLSQLRDCVNRADEWLRVQNEIAAHSLPQTLLAGARSAAPIE